MTIYCVLIACVVFLMVWDNNSNTLRKDQKRSNRILLFSFILIYLVCVLRSPTVGRDIPGYKEAYYWTKKVAFDNFDYIYFENGYIWLMKICLKLGVSFQGFFAVIYVIILYPIYLFIKKYSTDKLFSTLIYICYISFEFYLTGLRQAIAISIVLLAFIALLEAKKFPKILYIILVIIAATFHKSSYIALVFLIVFMVRSMFWYIVSMVAGMGISLLFRTYLFSYIKDLFGKESFSVNEGLHIGGNIIFMCGITIIVLMFSNGQKVIGDNSNAELSKLSLKLRADEFMIKAFMFGIVLAIFFGQETSARSFMFFSQAIMVLIPNMCSKNDEKTKFIFKVAFVLFFIAFFYFNTLKANNFDIVPYSFFWDT